jgi:hypothetical protein
LPSQLGCIVAYSSWGRTPPETWQEQSPPSEHVHTRPTVYAALGADSGFHAADVNLTLQNLVDLVAAQSKSWLHH